MITFQSQPRCPFFLNFWLDFLYHLLDDFSISTEMPVLPQHTQADQTQTFKIVFNLNRDARSSSTVRICASSASLLYVFNLNRDARSSSTPSSHLVSADVFVFSISTEMPVLPQR